MNTVTRYLPNALHAYSSECLVAMGSIIISFSSVFVKITDTAPTVTGVYRMLFGGMMLMILALSQRKKIWPAPSLMLLTFLTGTSTGIDVSFWHNSIHHVGPGVATVLGNCQVFLLILIGILIHKEKVQPSFFLSIPVAALGLFCLVGHKWGSVAPTYRLGVLQGLATAIFYSLSTATLKKTQCHPEKLDPTANLAWISLFSSIALSIVAYTHNESFVIPNQHSFYNLFFYALFSQVIGWRLISTGLAHVNLSTAGFLILLQPALSFVWDILFFHRVTPPIEMLGAIITLFAIYISVTSQKARA